MKELDTWTKKVIPTTLLPSLNVDFESVNNRETNWSWERNVLNEKSEKKISFLKSNEKITLEITLKQTHKSSGILVDTKIIGNDKASQVSWDRLQPIRITWQEEALVVRTVKGGSTETFYPPESYTLETRYGQFHDRYWRTSHVEIPTEANSISEMDYGRSSTMYLPIVLSGIRKTGGVIVSIEWSGPWKQIINGEGSPNDLTKKNHTHEAFIPTSNFQLAEGEEIKFPTTHILFYTGDVNNGSNRFRRYVYDNIVPDIDGQKPLPPINYNTFAGLGNDIDTSKLKNQADKCAELEVDYFTLDAGWIPEGFPEGVGNWFNADQDKFPEGLQPISNYVHSLGLKMGLWFDIERAHKESQIYNKHPELFLTIDSEHNKSAWYSPDMAHLDLADDRAQELALRIISKWVNCLNLKWIRFDYNLNPLPYWNDFESPTKYMINYMDGLYSILQVLRNKYPELLIENCASGGRRNDIGTLSHSHTSWFSDQTADPDIVRNMLTGANIFLPGNIHNSAVPVATEEFVNKWPGFSKQYSQPNVSMSNHISKKEVLSRMLGSFTLAGNIQDISSKETRLLEDIIKWYKKWRWILVEDYHLLESSRSIEKPDIVQFTSRTGEQALLLGFLADGKHSSTVSLKNLDNDIKYKIHRLDGKSCGEYKGSELMSKGIEVDISDDHPYIRTLTSL